MIRHTTVNNMITHVLRVIVSSIVFYILAYSTSVHSITEDAVPLMINGNIIRHGLFFTPVMPNGNVVVNAHDTDKSLRITAQAEAGNIINKKLHSVIWKAPSEPGNYTVIVRDNNNRSTTIKMLVMVPASKQVNGRLNGYRIDKYPATALRGLKIYSPPKGFIEVDRDDANTYISPNFRLGQFLCKQPGGFPKYILLRPELVLMLERLVAPLGENVTDGLHILSGYRTPYYNASIGNGRYSRHLWGGAADVFIDIKPRDGVMDDLNGDGKINIEDANVLFKQMEDILNKNNLDKYIGGLSSYSANSAHGPFLHLDVRGFKARW